MSKRVYQIAKEFDKDNKQVLKDLQKIGINKRTANHSLSEEEIEQIKKLYKQEPQKKKEKVKKQTSKTKIRKKRDKDFYKRRKEEGKISVYEGITIRDLAEKIGHKSKDIIQKLVSKGLIYSVNQSLSIKEAQEILSYFDKESEAKSYEDKVIEDIKEEKDTKKMVERTPVVTVMGHVDHGKTTLLDAIRNTNIVDSESGGITQHIGASKIKHKDNSIVFIDTPGHEAFTKLRLRGANVTDVVVLIVAADDGVMPQTIEAIDHTKSANVPIIVAINKIDKPEANPMKVKQELARHEIVVEDFGGDVVSVEISAKKKKGLDDLLDMIILVSEMLEIKGNPDIPAKGIILESKLHSQKGSVATVIIKEGTVSLQNAFISGTTYGNVKAIIDDKGRRLNKASMVAPVEIMGFISPPESGEIFQVVPSIEKARQIVELRKETHQEKVKRDKQKKMSLDDFFKKMKGEGVKELSLIVKADVHGSLEAIEDSVYKIKHKDVNINIVHKATGPVTEGDVLLASTTNSIIICYNVRANKKIREIARRENIEIRYYSVIYKLIEEVKASLEGILEPIEKEVFLGTAEVKQIFKVPKLGKVAGCYVAEGKVKSDAYIRVIRDGVVRYSGQIGNLKHYTKEIDSIKKGNECGIRIENFDDIKVGDKLEIFEIKKIKQKI